MVCKIIESAKCRFWNRFGQNYIKSQLNSCGLDVTIGMGFSACGFNNIEIGNHVYLGDGARFLCAMAPIRIGDYCMFGPEVMIITGNHRTDVIGEYMYNVKEKLPENDSAVIIEDDVWVGARAIILKGSRIGTGSIIAAGAIVTGVVPPYSIYFGKNIIKSRFSEEELIKHIQGVKKYDQNSSKRDSIL